MYEGEVFKLTFTGGKDSGLSTASLGMWDRVIITNEWDGHAFAKAMADLPDFFEGSETLGVSCWTRC